MYAKKGCGAACRSGPDERSERQSTERPRRTKTRPENLRLFWPGGVPLGLVKDFLVFEFQTAVHATCISDHGDHFDRT